MPRDRSDLATAEAAAGALRDALAQIEKARRRILVSDDPEGPHQMRVGLRRLRTALSLFEPALGKATTRNLSDAARKLGREVGELRDLEVVLHETVGPARDAAPDDPALAAIADGLTEAIGKERARLRSQLDKGRIAPLSGGRRAILRRRRLAAAGHEKAAETPRPPAAQDRRTRPCAPLEEGQGSRKAR